MNRSFARLQLAVNQITRRTSGNTTYYSRQEIINLKGASGGGYFCSVQEAMNDYGMSYDQVRHYLKQGKIQSQVISGNGHCLSGRLIGAQTKVCANSRREDEINLYNYFASAMT